MVSEGQSSFGVIQIDLIYISVFGTQALLDFTIITSLGITRQERELYYLVLNFFLQTFDISEREFSN